MPDIMLLSIFACSALITLGLITVGIRCYERVEQGTALVRGGVGGARVSFSGMLVYPVIHCLEVVDITAKKIVVTFSERESLATKDNMPVDVKIGFVVRIGPTPKDVLDACRWLGAAEAGDSEVLKEMFLPRFSQAVKTTVHRHNYEQLQYETEAFRQDVLDLVGNNLHGFIIESVDVDHLAKPAGQSNGAAKQGNVA